MEEKRKIKVSFLIEQDLYRKFAKYGSYKWDVVSAILSYVGDIEIDINNLYSMKPKEARKWILEEVRRKLNTKEILSQEKYSYTDSNTTDYTQNINSNSNAKKINSNDWW